MKKLATLATLMAGASLALGQLQHNPGIVSFQNTEATKAVGIPGHLVTNGVTGQLLLGTQFMAELYYLDTATSSLVPIPSTISAFKSTTATSGKGTWNGPASVTALPAGLGGIDVLDDGTGQGTFAEAGDGSGVGDGYYPVTLNVRVWDSTTGASYETATFRGNSGNFIYTQRYTGNPPPITDAQMITQRAFSVVPEPSAIALSILGVAGLLLIRRRK